ncbi:MAG TPA: hypothetical protein ENN18_07585 [Proteobacteria bacterium]|nr:hypothetical protein [Pseudomonadota bacterium]
MAFSKLRNWAKHEIFGLRKEWLGLYLDDPSGWKKSPRLGNRQVESLNVWLRTTGLVTREGRETWLCRAFRERGVEDLRLWELLWVNVVFSFPTALWYVMRLGMGQWSTAILRDCLLADVPRLSKRTVINAIMELVGLLERTPIGTQLGQGEVSETRPRIVARKGLAHPSWSGICYNLISLFQKEGSGGLNIDSGLPWPWIVFGCTREFCLGGILCEGKALFSLEDAIIRPQINVREMKDVSLF